jgi:hypothetical protein
VVAALISGGVVMAPEWTGCKGGWGARSCSTRDEDGGGRGKGRVGQSEVATRWGGAGDSVGDWLRSWAAWGGAQSQSARAVVHGRMR